MNPKYRLIIALWLAALLVSACNALPTASPATPTDHSDLFLPNCKRNPKAGLPSEPSPGRYESWYRYTNATYGFSLAFPPDWELIEEQNYICLRPKSEPTIIFIAGFKQDIEDIAIQRTGVGAGDLVTTGKINFLGKEISREVLKYQGKDKAILYNYGTEINANRLMFTLSLGDFRTDYEMVELSAKIESLADTIVESFKHPQ